MTNLSPSTNNGAPALPKGYWSKRVGFLIFAIIMVWVSSAAEHRLNDYAVNIVRLCGISVLMAVSLNIVNGLTGQFSIGHAGFMSVGAYVGASVTYFAEMRYTHQATPGFGWMMAAMLIGGMAAALFGLIVGVPSLRLQGDYLAIVTLGFGEIIRVLITNCSSISSNLSYLGGASGFTGASGAYSVPHLTSFGLLTATVLVLLVLTRNLKASQHGLAFMAIREDEIAAAAMGINTTRTKVTAFVISAFWAGIAGVLFAHAVYFVPLSFGFIASMNYVIMVVLGGSGSITGTAIAAVILTALPEMLKPLQQQVGLADPYRQVIFALLLIIMMLLRPEGVFGRGELSISGIRRRFSRTSRVDSESSTTTSSEPAAPANSTTATSDYSSLALQNVTRRFGGLVAVGDVQLEVKKGSLTGLIGPNGAGKTTVFNLLTGVYAPSEGTITYEGNLLAGSVPASAGSRAAWLLLDTITALVAGLIIGRIVATSIVPYAATPGDHALVHMVEYGIGLAAAVTAAIASYRSRSTRPPKRPHQFAASGVSRTFQNIRLFGGLTVMENVCIGSYVRRKTTLVDSMLHTRKYYREEIEVRENARRLLARFGLLDSANELASSLPYGDQRRLEIVRALATKPGLLLLDEPAAGMNPQEKLSLMSLIRQVRDEFALTIVLIEHDMKLVMGVCEQIYVLDYGRIIASGTPVEVRSDPAVISAYLGEEQESKPVGDAG